MSFVNWTDIPRDLFLRIFRNYASQDFQLLVLLFKICHRWRWLTRKIIQEPGFYLDSTHTDVRLHLQLFPDIKIMDLRNCRINHEDFRNLQYVERLCLNGKFNTVLLDFRTCIRFLDNVEYLDIIDTNISPWILLNGKIVGKFSQLKVLVVHPREYSDNIINNVKMVIKFIYG